MKGDEGLDKRIRKSIAYEVMAVLIACIFIVGGLLLQLKLSCVPAIICNSVDRNFTLVILQIQATVDTLTIAIIALISGKVSDSSMGIAISDYYMNIRPIIFKQKRIIISSLLLLVANIGFYIMEWYYIVLCLFAVTIIFILMSVSEVYLLFSGKKSAENEIKDYICCVLQKKGFYIIKYNICNNFVDDWKDIMQSQSKEEYESYKEMFLTGIKVLFSYKSQESICDIKEICKRAEYNFLNSENRVVRENGIELLGEIYETLWKCILKDMENVNYQKPFNLFGEICISAVEAVGKMSAEKAYKCVQWDGLLEGILRVTYWIGYDENYSDIELGDVYGFARYAGTYLSGNYNDKNSYYWKSILRKCFWLYTANLPEERVEDYSEAKCIINFNYIYGFVENGFVDLVVENFFEEAMANIFYLENKYQVLMGMLVHCYLYYLAKRESKQVLPQMFQDCAEKIITNKAVKKVFKGFLEQINRRSDLIDIGIMEQMIKILSSYEKIGSGSKNYLIMENVVREFYLFVILYLSHTYYVKDLYEKNLDDNVYTSYIYEKNEKKTKGILCEIYKLIDYKEETDETIKANVELMYDEFVSFEKRRFKEKQMQKALREQIQYILSVDLDEVIVHIKAMVKEKLTEKFKAIIIDSNINADIVEIPILTLFDYTNAINTNCVDSFCPNMYGQFAVGLEWILRKANILEEVDRKDSFLDDKEYMDYLRSNQLKLLIGSKFVLSNKDYMLTHEFDELTKDFTIIYTMLMERGLALKTGSVKVYIHSIDVKIRPQKISDERQSYNEETGLFTYSIYSGMPIDFNENELEAFLHDSRKVVEISAKISVQTEKERIGALIR